MFSTKTKKKIKLCIMSYVHFLFHFLNKGHSLVLNQGSPITPPHPICQWSQALVAMSYDSEEKKKVNMLSSWELTQKQMVICYILRFVKRSKQLDRI